MKCMQSMQQVNLKKLISRDKLDDQGTEGARLSAAASHAVRTFGGVAVEELRDELLPPPTPLSQRRLESLRRAN